MLTPVTPPCSLIIRQLENCAQTDHRPCNTPTPHFTSFQFSHSVVSDSATPWTATHQAFLFITNSWSLPKFMSTESVMPSNHLILCGPLLLPSIFPSIRVFSNESVLRIRWPKYWSFSFNISLSNEYSRLISFRIDWLNLPAVQGTLKRLLQHYSSKALVLWHSAFFPTSKVRETPHVTGLKQFLKFLFNFSCRRITLQYCTGFCHTSIWISHRHTYVLSFQNLPPTSNCFRLSQSTRFELPASYNKFLPAIYFTYGNLYVSMLLSQFAPPSSAPTMSTNLFYMSHLNLTWLLKVLWQNPWGELRGFLGHEPPITQNFLCSKLWCFSLFGFTVCQAHELGLAGKESVYLSLYITESLCCTSETLTQHYESTILQYK